MSLNDLTKLILSEAKTKTDEIITNAKLKADSISVEYANKAHEKIENLNKDFCRREKTLMASFQAKSDQAQKSAELSAIHDATSSAVKQSCEILLTDSKIRDSLRDWASNIPQTSNNKKIKGVLQLGRRIDEALPEIRQEAKKTGIDVSVCNRDYVIVYATGVYNEVLDLEQECRRVVDENLAEYVAILKNTQS